MKRGIALLVLGALSFALLGVLRGHVHGSFDHPPRCIASLVRLAPCTDARPLATLYLHLDAYKALVNALVVTTAVLVFGWMAVGWLLSWFARARFLRAGGKCVALPRSSPFRQLRPWKIFARFHQWQALLRQRDAAAVA